MVLLLPWKRTGSWREKETSKCCIGDVNTGGEISIVTPFENERIEVPDAVIASTVT